MSQRVNGTSALQHEGFEIVQPTTENRQKIIRQDRIDIDEENCWIEMNGQSLEVLNYSPFGFAILASVDGKEMELIENVPFIFENTEISRLKAKHVRSEKIGPDAYKVAYEVVGEPIPVEMIDAVKGAHKVIENCVALNAKTTKVPEMFRGRVYEMTDGLHEMKRQINNLGLDATATSRRENEQYEHTVVSVMSAYFRKSFEPLYAKLAESLKAADAATLTSAFEFFRDKLNSIIQEAPFADRVYNKPLGYAGDFQMMNIIYRSEPVGNSLFAKCLHQYFVEEPAAKAVRNRADYLFKIISKSLANAKTPTIKLLSVASGPAFEIQMTIEKLDQAALSRLEVHLLDQDIESLKHAQRKIKEACIRTGKTINVSFHNKAIKNIIARGLEAKNFDLIYSAGLFDYFSDPVAHMAGQKLADGLAPGGTLVIGNFNVSNPNQFTMNLALDWRLIYRSEADMERLFGGLGKTYDLDQEMLGINLFCRVTK